MIRCGEAPAEAETAERPAPWLSALALHEFRLQFALRLLLCALVAEGASPRARRRTGAADRKGSAALGVGEIFVTGGEPFLLEDIGEILTACAGAAPTTVLTNGMLLVGRRLEILRALPRDRVTLQISLDSPTPRAPRSASWRGHMGKAWKGIERARAEGFRVRLAATVATDAEAAEFRLFLDTDRSAKQDRVIRRIALRGFAKQGIALARADLVPEITVTADGVYWHPVGAEDADLWSLRTFFRSPTLLPRRVGAFERERAHAHRLATIFNCA